MKAKLNTKMEPTEGDEKKGPPKESIHFGGDGGKRSLDKKGYDLRNEDAQNRTSNSAGDDAPDKKKGGRGR